MFVAQDSEDVSRGRLRSGKRVDIHFRFTHVTTIVTQSRQVTYLKVKAPEPRLGCTILFWLLSAQIWYQMVIYQDSLSSHRKIVFDLQRWPESRLVQRRTIVPNLL